MCDLKCQGCRRISQQGGAEVCLEAGDKVITCPGSEPGISPSLGEDLGRGERAQPEWGHGDRR